MQFKIIDAFALVSANKLLMPKSFYATDDEAQIEELKRFEAMGSCKELVSVKPDAKKEVVETPVSDLASVKGIGAKILKKLLDAGVKSKAELKVALTAQTDLTKEILGPNFDKVSKLLA